MNFIDRLNAFTAGSVDLLWAILWQSTLMALAVAAICFLIRRSSPAVRYWLWQIVAIKLLLMPFWTFALTKTAAENSPVPDLATDTAWILVDSSEAELALSQEPTAIAPEPGTASLPVAPAWWQSLGLNQISLATWLMILWAVAVVCQFGRLLYHQRRLRRLLQSSLANKVDPRCVELSREIAARLGLRATPGVRFTELDGSPFVCGIRAPLLVMPRALFDRLDGAQLRQVLLHELAHIKRRDLLWGWIPEIARVMYFFHPIAHWVCARIRLERELACDQAAMTVGQHTPADYAATLVQVVSHVSQPSVLEAATVGRAS